MLQVIKIQSSYYVLLKKKARKIHRTSVYLFCHIMFFFGGGGGDFFFSISLCWFLCGNKSFYGDSDITFWLKF